jgi:hypothetical protein
MEKYGYKIVAGSEMLNIAEDEKLLNDNGQEGQRFLIRDYSKPRWHRFTLET